MGHISTLFVRMAFRSKFYSFCNIKVFTDSSSEDFVSPLNSKWKSKVFKYSYINYWIHYLLIVSLHKCTLTFSCYALLVLFIYKRHKHILERGKIQLCDCVTLTKAALCCWRCSGERFQYAANFNSAIFKQEIKKELSSVELVSLGCP